MFEGSTIIYCPSRKKTENVAAALQGKWKKLHVMYIEGTIESKFVDWMEKWISISQL
jgi:superfamily II DNA helicase RecQ